MNKSSLHTQVKEWRLDSNIVLLYPEYENISDLEMDWDNFISMNKDLQNDSDEKSIELFGNTNQDRYEIMLHKFYDNDSVDKDEFKFNKDSHIIDREVDDLFFAMNYDKDKYFYNKYVSASIQESMNGFDPNPEYISKIEDRLFNDNTDFIDESFTYPYYTPKEIEYYDKKFKDIKLPIKESLFVAKWKKVYNEAFTTGNFRELKSLNEEWKEAINRISNSNDMGIEAKKKELLNLGCNYALPVETLDKQGERVKNAISSIFKNIRVYTANDIGDSKVVHYTYDKSFYYNFIEKINLWIIVNKYSGRIDIAFNKSVPLYTDGIDDRDTVVIYCTRIQNMPTNITRDIRFSNGLDIKYLMASIINSFNTPITLFKVFEGTYENFSENCLGLYVLYMIHRHHIDRTIEVDESTDIFSEANTTNEFPVEFNKDGDLLISKGKKIDFEGEYSRTHLALKIYEKNGNIVGMKYCICKLWYLNIKLEEKIHDKNTTPEEKRKAEKARSKIINDITKYSQIVLKKDPNFDIIKTYQNSPFNDDKIRIPNSTLDHTLDWIKRLLKFKKGF